MKQNIFFVFFILVVLLAACSGNGAKKLKIGDTVPTFTAEDIDGKHVSLANMKGKPVILRFWSTECKFCRADTPVFNNYYNRFKEKGLHIYYINTSQTKKEVRDFMKDLDVQFPVILDAEGELAKKYHVKLQPLTIVISPEHTLLAAILGGISNAELEDLIAKDL